MYLLPSRRSVSGERTLSSLSHFASYLMIAASLTRCEQGTLETILLMLPILPEFCVTLPKTFRVSCRLFRVVERNRHCTQDSRLSWGNNRSSSCSSALRKSDNSDAGARKHELAFIFQYLRVLQISSASLLKNTIVPLDCSGTNIPVSPRRANTNSWSFTGLKAEDTIWKKYNTKSSSRGSTHLSRNGKGISRPLTNVFLVHMSSLPVSP